MAYASRYCLRSSSPKFHFAPDNKIIVQTKMMVAKGNLQHNAGYEQQGMVGSIPNFVRGGVETFLLLDRSGMENETSCTGQCFTPGPPSSHAF